MAVVLKGKLYTPCCFQGGENTRRYIREYGMPRDPVFFVKHRIWNNSSTLQAALTYNKCNAAAHSLDIYNM